jgi:hypothetical protein
MDIDTFLTTLYVLIDDWYQAEVAPLLAQRRGRAVTMSDSEVLTVALAGQWQVGVPWRSERGVVRYLQQHGRPWFRTMLGRSAFNQRVRNLCTVLAALQRHLASVMAAAEPLYEVADGVPLPVCSLGQAARAPQRWLMQTSRGHGGNHGGWFFGQRWWVSATADGVITGWLVGSAHLNERWLLEAFLSQRAGDGELRGPRADPHTARAERITVPGGFIGGHFAVGDAGALPYLVDRGLNGGRWQQHWHEYYAASVLAIPPANSAAFQTWTPSACRQHAGLRQVIEGVFAILDGVFGLKRVNAHSQWGQYTRLAAKAAAYNMALLLNRLLNRPLLAVATLLI